MEKEKKILGIKNFTLVVVISSIMLALCTIFAFGTVAGLNIRNAQDWELNGSKSVSWDDETHTSGKIEVLADVVAKESYVPNVLFVGTMCYAHGLRSETVANALNSITKTSNVDYFLFNNNEHGTTGDLNGSLARDDKITEAQVPISKTGNHQALGKFFKCIYEQTQIKDYDFIVLEFDGTRISDWYHNLKAAKIDREDTGTIDGTYPKYYDTVNNIDLEAKTAEILNKYYKSNSVIWVTDNEWEGDPDAKSGYRPTKLMNVRTYDFYTRKINFNSLKALLAPELYDPLNDTPEWTQKDIEDLDASLSDTKWDYFPDEYILDGTRQVGYKHSETVGNFLETAISELFSCKFIVEDWVDVADNITFNTEDVSLYKWNGEGWESVDLSTVEEKIIDTTTGQVKIVIPDIKENVQFKLEIKFRDKSITERFVDVSVDGNPNNGAAVETIDPYAGSDVTKDFTPDKEERLDWPIDIDYKVEDKYQDKVPELTNYDDHGIPSIPSDKVPEGSKASVEEGGKYVFVNWTLGEDGPVVSTDPNFKPKPDEVNNRYHAATYVAHFAPKYSTIKYEVQGAEIEVGSGVFVIPDDSIKPGEETVDFGEKDYVLKGQIPTTKWTTSDGTAEGIPGSWTFKGNCWYDSQKYDTVFEKIDKVTENEYVAYGKWEFTPAEPSSKISVVKTANFDDETTIAKPGDIIEYKIIVSNNAETVVNNLVITDNVNKTLEITEISDPGLVNDNVITWNIVSIESKGTKEVSFKAKIPENLKETTVYSNNAFVVADGIDQVVSNTTKSKASIDTPGPGPTPGPTPDPDPAPTPGGNSVKTGDIVSGTALLILAGLFVAGMFIIRLRTNKD